MDHTLDPEFTTLFFEALDLEGEERAVYLAEVRARDTALADKLDKMVDEFLASEGFFEQSFQKDLAAMADELAAEDAAEPEPEAHPFTRYRIIRPLGEGGMGRVDLAYDPKLDRNVALKLIHARSVSRAFLSRFESEYRFLALMDHPNIAHLLDAGKTPEGDLYFTMDHVDGRHITTFCQEERLGLEQRLQLFLQVCDGVAHAHLKGVVHRDLKPSNILVAGSGSDAQVKIIDFGVAKDVRHELGSRTTLPGTLVGTPVYMSPEQLAMDQRAIDTRSDVYALGVILYEMLTGSPPYGERDWGNAPLDEVIRYYREGAATLPSRKVLKSEHSEVGGRLARRLRGDLDVVILKAMAKEVAQRYNSVTELRDDLVRFLQHFPVQARKPGFVYRTRKFVVRNKILVGAALVTGLGLLVGLIVALRAHEQTRYANLKLTTLNQFLQGMLAAPDPRQQGIDTRMIDVLEGAEKKLVSDFSAQPELEADARFTIGKTYFALGRYTSATIHLQRATELRRVHLGEADPATNRARYFLSLSMARQGAFSSALDLLATALRYQREQLGPDHRDTRQTRIGQALVLSSMARFDEAEAIYHEVLAGFPSLTERPDQDALKCLTGLATVVKNLGRLEEALSLYRQALRGQEDLLGEDHPETMATRYNLGVTLKDARHFDEAEETLNYLWQRRVAVLGENHPLTLETRASSIRLLLDRGKLADAGAQLDAMMGSLEGNVSDSTLAIMLASLARYFGRMKRHDEAASLLEDLLELRMEGQGERGLKTLSTMNNLGNQLILAGRPAEALPILTRALDVWAQRNSIDERDVMITYATQGEALEALGRNAEALDAYCQALEVAPDRNLSLNRVIGRMYDACLKKSRSGAAAP